MLLNLIGALIGFGLGSVTTFGALFGSFYIISLFIADQTALGWVWVLYLLIVPIGALVGLVLGYIHLGTALNGFNT